VSSEPSFDSIVDNQLFASQSVFYNAGTRSLEPILFPTTPIFLGAVQNNQLPLLTSDVLSSDVKFFTDGISQSTDFPVSLNNASDNIFHANTDVESWQFSPRASEDQLQEIVDVARQKIAGFFQQPNWRNQLALAFGDSFDSEQAKKYSEQLPAIEVLPEIILGTASGAFSAKNNTIFLSRNLIERGDSQEITAVLIEEIGHSIDAYVNQKDSSGDEGEIFARLVEGSLNQSDYLKLLAEDDHTIRWIDGQWTEIEQSSLSGNPEVKLAHLLGDVLLVPGSSSEKVNLSFQWTERNAAFNNEIGVFVVDAQGRVNGIDPSSPKYAQTALSSSTRKVIFTTGEGAGNWEDLSFQGGEHLAFYLIQNSSTDVWLRCNPNNQLDSQPVAFFSVNGSNPDGFDHVNSENLGRGNWRLRWEDVAGGGDQDFNDVVFTVSQPGVLIPGQKGERSLAKVDFVSQNASYFNEMGYYLADDAEGRVGNLLPGDAGYAQAALSTSRHQVVFAQYQGWSSHEYELPSTQYVGWYLISNGSTSEFLEANPDRQPQAFFSYSAANPDGLSHLHQKTSEEWGWEDLIGGGDLDFNDLVFRFELGLPINQPPVALKLNRNSIIENNPINSLIGTFSSQDPTDGDIHTYSLTTGIGDSDNSAFSIVNNELRINTVADFETKSTYALRVKTTDKLGSSFDQDFTVNIINADEPPMSLTLNQNSMAESSPVNSLIGAFSSQDPDAGDSHTYSLTTGIGDGDNSAFSIVNNELRINTTADFETKPTYGLRVKTTDKSGLSFDQDFTISIININESPTTIVLSQNMIAENIPANSLIGSFSSQDPDANDGHTYGLVSGAGDLDNRAFTIVGNELRIKESPDFEVKQTYSIRVKTTDLGGLSFQDIFSIAITNVNEKSIIKSAFSVPENIIGNVYKVTATDPDMGDVVSWTLAGADKDLFLIDANSGNLSFKQPPDFETPMDADHDNTYELTLVATDKGGLTSLQSIALTVIDLNENQLPVITSVSTVAITENISGNIYKATATSPGDVASWTLAGTDKDLFLIDANSGNLSFKQPPNFEAPADADYNNVYELRLIAKNKSGLSADQALKINVSNLNETPTVLQLSNINIAENSLVDTVIGQLTTTDPDLNDAHLYSLIAGTGDTDNTSFNIVNNELKINNSADFEAKPTYSLRIRTTDKGGLSFDQNFSINITNVNEPPRILTLSRNSIAENSPPNSLIGTFGSQDPDAGDGHTYGLVAGIGDLDNGAFTIIGDELRIKDSPDFEVKQIYSIRVKTTDLTGLSIQDVFSVVVTDVNEKLIITSAPTITVPENINGTVYKATAISPDLGDVVSWTLAGTDKNLFFIDATNGNISFKQLPNFEVPIDADKNNVYNLTLIATNKSGLSTDQVLIINVSNLNEAPTVLRLNNNSIAENSLTNTVIGQLTTTDSDLNDAHTYSLVTGIGGEDNASFSIVADALNIQSSPDFETKPLYNIRVKTTDIGGLSHEQVISVNVININESPVTDNDKVLTVNEDSGETALAIQSPTDVDGNLLTITVNEVPNKGLVKLGNGTAIKTGDILTVTQLQKLFFTPTLNLNGDAGAFRYTVSDGQGGTDSQSVTLKINLVNDRPTLNIPSGQTVKESTNLAISGVGVDDIDAEIVKITLAVSHGTLSLTQINGLTFITGDGSEDISLMFTGMLSNLNAALNSIVYRSNINFSGEDALVVTVDDLSNTGSGGALTANQTINIAVTPLNSPPVAEDDKLLTVDLNSGANSLNIQSPIDLNGDPLTITVTAIPNSAKGNLKTGVDDIIVGKILTLQELQQLVFTPVTDVKGNAGFFSYKVEDGQGASDSQTVILNISPVILLQEKTDFKIVHEEAIIVPDNKSVLHFRYQQLNFDKSANFINDAFEVAFVDELGNSLVHTIASGKDAFFNATENRQISTGASTIENNQFVTLDLSEVPSGTIGKLIFRLVNNDGDTQTSIRISNIEVIPGVGSGKTGFTSKKTSLQSNQVIDFNGLEDVSSSTKTDYQQTSFNENTKILSADVAIKNIGTYGFNKTLIVAVRKLSDPSINLIGSDGITPDGLPYYDFTNLVGQSKLDPNQLSQIKTFTFSNPQGIQFTYELVVLAGINKDPVIDSKPIVEVIAGQPYQYDVNAVDINGDRLTYQLKIAPDGMTINSETGLISWTTAKKDISNHQITVEVTDGQGGKGVQTYTLGVIDIPPNRPPLFTSNPVVDAYIKKLYQYDANAIDPDQDPLTYSLIVGPNGLTINPDTGLVQWTPPPALILGDTVLGRIAIPGEKDEFSFGGVAGQRIYIDPLQYSGNYYDWSFDIYSPSGVKIVDQDLDGGFLFNLTEDGNYRIVVNVSNNLTGSYGFRIIDTGLAAAGAFDTVISSNLALGSEDDIYTFRAAEGQKLFLNALSRDGNLGWAIYGPNNQTIAGSAFNDLEVDLLVSGEYVLAVYGQDIFTKKVNYSFEIITPQLSTAPLTLGAVVSGSIVEAGEQDTYTFAGTAGQQLFYDALGGDALRFKFIDPTGKEIFNVDSNVDRGSDNGLTLSVTGTYKIVIDGIGDSIGNYKFQLLDKAGATVLNLDTDVTGTLDNGGIEADGYRFTLTDRQYIYIDGQVGNYDNAWILYGVGGQEITRRTFYQNQGSTSYNDAESLLDVGEYWLVLQGNGAEAFTGGNNDYKLRVVTPQLSTAPLTLGAVVSDSIVEAGEQDTYTFAGTAGQQLFYDALGGDALRFKFIDPTGKEIFNADSNIDRGSDNGLTLSVTGTYKVVIDGIGDSLGKYKFQLLDKAGATVLNLDTDVTGTLDNGGIEADGYRFTLTDRQYIYIDGQVGNYDNAWILYGVGGQEITRRTFYQNQGSTSYNDAESLLDVGEYWLVLQGNGAEAFTGGNNDYKLRVVTPQLSTAPLTLGAVVSDSIVEAGEQDTYTFAGTAGQQLFYDALGGDALRFKFIDPAGKEIFNADSNVDHALDNGLTLSGTYKVVIDGVGDLVGNYKFRLLDQASATVVNLNTDITGQLNPNATSDFYRLTAIIGQQLRFDSLNTNFDNTYWTLYDASGRIVWSRQRQQDIDYSFLANGIYTLQIQNYSNSSVDYAFRVTELSPGTSNAVIGKPLTLGTIVDSSIDQVGERDTYTFAGTAGQQLFYDALGGDALRFKLIDPTGREILNIGSRSDYGPNSALTLSVSGTYQVAIDGDNIGKYKFRLLDKAKATVVNLDTDITGTLDNDGIGADGYRFTLTDRPYIYIDGQVGNYDNAWILYGSGGQYITSKTFYQNQGSTDYNDAESLLDAGDYWLVLQGNGAEAFTGGNNDYKLKIVTPQLNTAPLTLDKIVSGRIDEVGQQDTYTFAGTAGQQLFYDALGGSDFRFKFIDPTGKEVFNVDNRNDYGSNSGLTLSVNGTYLVVIDGLGDKIGDYKFRFLDKANAAVISLDTDIVGTFDNGGIEADSYRFTLTDRQYIYVDGQVGSYDNAWILYGIGGQEITRRTFYQTQDSINYNDAESLLDAGDYWLVLQGNGAEAGGNNNYKFRVVTPQLNTASLTLGTVASGRIGEVGQQDTYTFTGTAGQQLFYDSLGGDALRFKFIDPTGKEIFNIDSRNDRGSDGGLTLSVNGTYRVIIDGVGDSIGDYKFRLLDKANAAVVNLDTDIIGTFDNGGIESDSYRFTLTDRQYIYIDGQVGNYDNAWILYGTGGQYITSKTFYQNQNSIDYNDAESLLDAGAYWLVLQGNGAEAFTGGNNNYKFRVVTPQLNTAPLTLDTIASGRIAKVGQQDTYTFTGTAGQQLFYDALGGDALRFKFIDPTGKEIFNIDSRSDRGSDAGLTLFTNGTYRVVIDGAGDNIGDYKFRLLDKANATVVSLDTDIVGTFGNGGIEADSYRFTLTDRQYIYVDGQVGNYDNAWILYGAGGQYITSKTFYQNQGSTSFNDAEFLLDSGEYWFVLQGNGAEAFTGGNNDYKLKIVTPTLKTTAYTLGSVVIDSISEQGEQDSYTFVGNAGQRLFLDGLVSNSRTFASLTAPSGKSVFSNQYIRDNRTNIVLDESGIYRLTIDGAEETTENYGFRLLEYGSAFSKASSQASIVNFNTEITGAFDDPQQQESDFYRFNSSAGQYLYIDTLKGEYPNGWTIFRPNGEILISGFLSEDREVRLLDTGEYTLEVWGAGSGSKDYKLNLLTPELKTVAYGLGEAVVASLIQKGEQDTYTFEGNVGQQLFFDVLTGNGSIRASIYAPSGGVVAARDIATDWNPFTLTEKGIYRLVIDGNTETTGDYSFILADRAKASKIDLNTPISNTLTSDKQSHIYQLSGVKGTQLAFDLAANSWPQSVSWKLYDPNNNLLKSPNYSRPDFTATLPSNGSYTLVIEGAVINAVDYSFTVKSTSVLPVVNKGFRQIITETITNAGGVESYTFDANGGTSVWIDQISSSSGNIRARLKNPDGTYVFSDHNTNYDVGAVLLEQTGTYSLETFHVFYYDNSTTGKWEFQIVDLISDPLSPLFNPQPFNDVREGTLSKGTATEIYQIEAIVGQKLLFNGIKGSNIDVYLIDPNGKQVFSKGSFNDLNALIPTLTQEGIYQLVISGNNATDLNYSYQLVNLAAGPQLSINSPVKGTLASGQQSVAYQLEGKADQKLFFGINKNSPSARIKVYNLNRQDVLYETSLSSNSSFELTLPKDGIYTVLIEGEGSSTPIDYNFQVLAVDQQFPGILIPGNGGSNDIDASIGKIPVKLAVKDTKGATAIQDFTIRLWPDPDNTAPTIISNPNTRHALTQPIYRYQIASIDPDRDSLQYRLVNAPSGALLDKDTGELIWVLDNSVVAGTTYDFGIEVADGRGGTDRQNFKVEAFNKLGAIQGLAFEDLNRNGILDLDLVKGNNPDVFFVIEYSCAVSGGVVDWTKADLATAFSQPLSPVDRELGAILLMSEYLTKQGFGNTSRIGILDGRGEVFDMDPSQPGIQVTTTALADNNNNGIADIREALHRPTYGSSPGAIVKAVDLHESLKLTGDLNVMFMTSGNFTLKSEDKIQIEAAKASGVNISAFTFAFASLPKVREIDPEATLITSTEQIYNIFTGNVLGAGFDFKFIDEPLIENALVYLDLNNNQVLDLDEPKQLTQKPETQSRTASTSKYYFNFDNLLPGTYSVRQVVPGKYLETTPITGSFIDTVTDSQNTFTHFFGTAKNPNSEPVNQTPVITSTAPVGKIDIGQKLIYRAQAADADRDTLTFDLPIAPTGMTIDPKLGIIIWQPKQDQAGTIPGALLRVQDGKGGVATQYFELEVVTPNTAPIFTSIAPENALAQVGKTFRYQATAQDPDGDPLSYSIVPGAPTSLSIDAKTGLVTWTANNSQLGTADFTIKVADDKGGEALQTLQLKVNPASPNQAPIITFNPRTTQQTGATYSYQIQASDPDGNTLTYSLPTAPTGMTVNRDGLIIWETNAAQSGSQNVTLRVSDGELFTEQTFAVDLSYRNKNSTPIITSSPDSITNLEKTYSYNLTGQDGDGDLLLWSLDKAPEGMVIDVRTGALRWLPQSSQLGPHQVIVKVLDSLGAFSTQEYTLSVNGTNTPPRILSTPITKTAIAQPYNYNVTAIDPENSPLSYSLGRRPNGMTIDDAGKIQWTPTQVGNYDIEVVVIDAQGASATQTYKLVVGTETINQAPNITSTPSFGANLGSLYQYQIQASDPEGQALTYQIIEAPSGMTINANTGLVQWATPVAGNYQVVVAAFDSAGLGVTQGYKLVAKANGQPVILSTTPPTDAVPGITYHYDIQATDPDGDSLTYSLDSASKAKGIKLDDRGRLTWTPTLSQLGTHSILLTVTDGISGEVTQSYNLKVAADTTAPKVIINRSQASTNKGEQVSFQVSATDNVGIANLQLLIDNNPVVIDSRGVAVFTPIGSGVITAKAIAVDAAGNKAEATTTVNVLDPTDTEAPIVSLDLSAIVDDVINVPTQIRGSVNDTNLAYYALEVAPVDGSAPFKEVFRGTTPVTNGVLGILDPTLLPNDTYQVRLIAYDVNGHGNGVTQLLDVRGALKLGNFQLSFTDLEIPVGGIPITLTRTYDSLYSSTKDDLGYGWRVEFRNADVRTSLPKDELYQEYGFRGVGFKEGDAVYITLPGGKRERFTFKLKDSSNDPLVNAFLGRRGLYKPTFTADKDSTSTLTVQAAGVVLIRGEDNQIVPVSGGSAFRFYHPQDWGNSYRLTTKEGIIYDIDATTGDITTVTNRNGDTLTLTDAGISNSNGQSVTFERDPQGRITTVTDQMGKKIKYEYDAKGDLIKVTDRENNSTQFKYNSAQAHYLNEIIDPLGRTGIKNEYDEKGRLIKVINGAGNAVQLEYNPNNFIYSVKDQLGNSTTYESDARGNTISEIDALGGIIKRTYDDSNNLLSEANPEGEKTSYTYDSKGNKLSETDPLGNVTRYTYNTKNDVLSTTDATGNVVANTYDDRGNVLSISGLANGKTTLTYDANGLLTALITAEGTTKYEYDFRGNTTKEISPLGNETTYTYNANGDRLTETRKVNTPTGVKTLVTKTEYDAKGKVTKITDAEEGVTETIYDAAGQKIKEIDALGRVTKYTYSNSGQLLETIYPDATPNSDVDNPRTRKQYDAANRVTGEIDELGRLTEFQYDALGRLVYTIYPDATPSNSTDNSRKETRYDKAGRAIAEVDERGNITRYIYDDAGRRIETIYPDGTPDTDTDNPRILLTYNALGQRISETDQLGRKTQFTYDSLGRATGQIFADNTTISSTFDNAGRTTARIDQAGNRTEYEYNAAGKLTAVIDALKNRTEYGYSQLDDLLTQKDAKGNVTRYEYDGLGRRVSTQLLLNQLSNSKYDKVGNIVSATDFNGQTINFTYDERNRLISKTLPGNNQVTYTYTLTGQRASETDSNGTTSYQYDSRDRLISRTNPDGVKIEYTYDATGNRTSVSVPSGKTSYTFDEQNRLKSVTDPSNGLTGYTYDLAGNLIKTTLPNGTTETREYNLLNRLLYLQNTNSSGVISSFRYTLDKIGNRLAVVEQDGRKVDYEYDALYRLLKEAIVDGTSKTIGYTYDSVSNRLTRNDSVAGITTYEYDKNDRLLKEVNNSIDTIYTYDSNGNTLSKTTGADKLSYQWDAENRLIGVDKNGDGINDVTNQYDSDGIRVAQTVNGVETRFLVDKNRDYAQVLEEYSPSKVIKVGYVYGNDLISQIRDGQQSFYHVDGLGSTRTLTDINGLVTDTYDYEAFGKIVQKLGIVNNSYLFAGEQRDSSTGLDYLRARYLDIGTGRFYGRDPFGGIIFRPITLHKYVYAGLNPVNFVDPTGRFFSLAEFPAVQNIILQTFSTTVFGGIRIGLTFAISEKVLKPAYEARSEAFALIGGENDDLAFKAIEQSQLVISLGYQVLKVGLTAVGVTNDLGLLGKNISKLITSFEGLKKINTEYALMGIGVVLKIKKAVESLLRL
jgi:large repetitive protein